MEKRNEETNNENNTLLKSFKSIFMDIEYLRKKKKQAFVTLIFVKHNEFFVSFIEIKIIGQLQTIKSFLTLKFWLKNKIVLSLKINHTPMHTKTILKL